VANATTAGRHSPPEVRHLTGDRDWPAIIAAVVGAVLVVAGIYLFFFPTGSTQPRPETGTGTIVAVLLVITGVIVAVLALRRRGRS
jgi:protein-S-isoprenylcysteine O-methyltransferase Ste14